MPTYQMPESAHQPIDVDFQMSESVHQPIDADFQIPENGHQFIDALLPDARECTSTY
nr:hypothetical protein [uncultured Acetobacteroides sp.]